MRRRELLKKTTFSLASLSTLPSVSLLFSRCGVENEEAYHPLYLSQDQYQVIHQISRLILPKTDTPGANEAQVAAYIDLLFAEYFDEADISVLERGMESFLTTCREKYEQAFLDLDPSMQTAYLLELDEGDSETSFFGSMKAMVLWAFFTSEPGMTSMNYTPLPGKYDGCLSIDRNEKNLVGNR